MQNLVKIRHLSRTEKRYRDEYRAQLTNNPEHKQEVCCWMFNKKTHSVYNKTAGETIINVLAAKFNNTLHAFLIRVYLHRLSRLAFQLKENATFCCVNVT